MISCKINAPFVLILVGKQTLEEREAEATIEATTVTTNLPNLLVSLF